MIMQRYLLGSIAVGTVTGAIHGYWRNGFHVESILMQGLTGMFLGPYAPLVIPYVLFSSKCAIGRQKSQ